MTRHRGYTYSPITCRVTCPYWPGNDNKPLKRDDYNDIRAARLRDERHWEEVAGGGDGVPLEVILD